MRIYTNCKEAISEIQRDLFEMGVEVASASMQNKNVEGNKDFVTKELQAYTFMILNSTDKNEMDLVTLDWCKAEFKERIKNHEHWTERNPLNPGEAYKLREEVWNEFLVEGKFCYTYNERMYWQINDLIKELKEKPNTRQAIIQVHDRNIDQANMGGKKRLPCSMYYQFMIREGKLDIIYNMRSTDFFTHFQNDIWLACELRNFISEKIDVPIGKFIMQASSLHAYSKDFPEDVF